MEPAEYRRTSYEAWRAMAPGWERWRAQLAEDLSPVRTWLITNLAPQPGDTVLELCAGPGDTGFAAAERIGDGGRLLSTDFSP
jgi:ubiquinone/menaquinone biosynthesis C-methylase UbiE